MSLSSAPLLAALRKLAARPTDHGAWLSLVAQLAAAGHAEDAERALFVVGQSAVHGGQVALAVACGRLLAQRGNMRGPELLEEVAVTYCQGSERAAADGVPAPHGEPVALALPAEDAAEAEVLAAVRAAIEVLGPVATRPAPGLLPLAPLLSGLSVGGARALIGVMSARSVRAGERIVDVGEPASSLYWLAYGTVVVRRDGVRLGELFGGAFFGEIALVGGTRRTAQVVASSDVWLLEIPARAVEAAAQRHPQLAEVLATHAKERLLANVMRTSDLLSALGDDDRAAVRERLTTSLVEAGARIITEGEASSHLWIVVNGRCQVRRSGSELAVLGPGAVLGEISLVTGKPAVAEVVATERTVLMGLARADFAAVTAAHPRLLARLEAVVAEREAQNQAPVHDATDLLV